MPIQKLPQYLINQLKAGEIVERPASIVKELIENSLDAGATSLTIDLTAGGKDRIIVRDNGSGVDVDDLPRMVQRYATSKILTVQDLESLGSYGFRGEALSAIAEVSAFSVQTKTIGSETGYQLMMYDGSPTINPVAFADAHGTHVIVDQLFAQIPVREKYLKSDATERKYIRQLVLTYALIHFDKSWTLIHNSKQIFNLQVHDSVIQRAGVLFQSSWESKWQPLEYCDDQIHCWGLRGDASLHFPTSQHLYLIVNSRPVQDKLLRKAILTAYQRQIVPGSYPFVIMSIDIDSTMVDVNIHPRKSEVKFIDPGSIFSLVKNTLSASLRDQKVSYSSFKKQAVTAESRFKKQELRNKSFSKKYGYKHTPVHQQVLDGMKQVGGMRSRYEVGESSISSQSNGGGDLMLGEHHVQVVGQLHAMYILCESSSGLILVDQHALAERVMFEKMRQAIRGDGFVSEVLLTPVTVDWSIDQSHSELLARIGFDISPLSATSAVLYAIPQIFSTYRVDIQLLLQCLEGVDPTTTQQPYDLFALILDEIMGMKACKASINAGQRLSHPEMCQLIRDASGMIDGLFVCQHGRPSVVLIPQGELDGLFDRH